MWRQVKWEEQACLLDRMWYVLVAVLRGVYLLNRLVRVDTNSLTLGGVTRPITKVADQGSSAITYKVDGGWPDSTGSLVTAYAKTGPSKSSNSTSENLPLTTLVK